MMQGHKGLHMVTVVLMWIGGLNWLVYALVGSEVGQWVFGSMTATGSTVVYVLVGLATVYEIVMHSKHCKMCKPGSESASQQM